MLINLFGPLGIVALRETLLRKRSHFKESLKYESLPFQLEGPRPSVVTKHS